MSVKIEHVRKAIVFLNQNGSKITIRNVYDLVKGGSFSTITKLIKQIEKEDIERQKEELFKEVGTELIDGLAAELAKVAYQCKYTRCNEIEKQTSKLINSLIEKSESTMEELNSIIQEKENAIIKYQKELKEQEIQNLKLNQDLIKLKEELEKQKIIMEEKSKQYDDLKSLISEKINSEKTN